MGALWQIYAVMLLVATGSAGFYLSNRSLQPNLLERREYMLANSLKVTDENLQQILGPATGGLIVGFFGFDPAFVAEAATFAVSAGAVALIRHPGCARAHAHVDSGIDHRAGARPRLACADADGRVAVALVPPATPLHGDLS